MFRLDATEKLTWERDSRGYRAFLSLGKVGLPLEYLQLDSGKLVKRVETIDEDELFNEDSIRTAFALPITLGHPPRGRFANNADNLMVGSLLQEVRKDDGTLRLLAQVHDHRGIQLIDQAIANGQMAEVSPGYALKALQPVGERLLQRGRTYDHVSILAPGMGRGGKDICFHTDSLDIDPELAISPTIFTFNTDAKQKENKHLYILRLDSREFRVEDQELFNSVQALQSRLDAADAAKATAEASVATLTGELEGTKQKLTEAENARLDSNALSEEIKLRLDTWAVVEPELRREDSNFQRDNSFSVDQIRVAYLEKKAPDALKRMDNNNPNYSVFVGGLWEALKPQQRTDAAEATVAANATLDELDSNLETEIINPSTEARRKAIADLENAYKN
jgi:hypothetical protein